MNTNRRKFISTALAGSAVAALPFSCKVPQSDSTMSDNFKALDEVLKQPVLKRELFSEPVIIETLELLQDRNNFICRVRSTDGAEGISIGHPWMSKVGYPLFFNCLTKHFIGNDARNLDSMMHNAVILNPRYQGNPLCVQLATIEFAILDMLGVLVNKPMGQIIGDLHHPEVEIYLGTRINELRKMEPEVSLALMKQDQIETAAKAIKLRAGVGNYTASNLDNAPGRTEKLIKMAREVFGDDMILMMDGNGTYDVKEAIRLGKMLEAFNYYFWEEPVPWDWYEEQKQVKQGLNIKMAGGEEEFGLHAFRWLVGNNAFDIFQPDLFYFGGMIRTMQVARMAGTAGKTITPHMSNGGLGYLYMLQMVSVTPNADKYHEFKMFETKDANGTIIPIESKTEPFSSVDGVIKVPTGSGIGINIDPDYIKTHTVLKY